MIKSVLKANLTKFTYWKCHCSLAMRISPPKFNNLGASLENGTCVGWNSSRLLL